MVTPELCRDLAGNFAQWKSAENLGTKVEHLLSGCDSLRPALRQNSVLLAASLLQLRVSLDVIQCGLVRKANVRLNEGLGCIFDKLDLGYLDELYPWSF